MAQIEIFSPVALGPTDARPLVPPLATLRGKVLGIRVDRAWRSFDVFADELTALATPELGVRDVVRFDPDTRIGTPRPRAARSPRSRAASTRRSSVSAREGRARRGVSTTRSSANVRACRP